ncbi:hypothetical protein BVC80_9029g20 [Macleaya cordata]|uniref:OCRE domain-containing protein n=1 Tax=Macleaya cordata TaxID=56857 RepID=A0A200QUQ6_MACCD|nr:hypothetical protein BVC80_9029g20 [Macleaya cordata]
MEGKSSRSHLKRALSEDEDSNKPPKQKRPRFPKGKKVKVGEEFVVVSGPVEGPKDLTDPKQAAIERRKRRTHMTADSLSEELKGKGISAAEVAYEDNANFVEDGIQIEPFNLNQEKEEGYFDDHGNFVEFANDNNIKDAWLDSVDVDTRFAEKSFNMVKDEEDTNDLSSEDIGKMKRRIANLLEPGETVLQALRRLKGNSNDKKEKMPEETKLKFDQLTEDSMKLMENGDYDVYHEKRESFEREAEGYERLARAREGTSGGEGNGNSDSSGMDIFSNGVGPGAPSTPLTDAGPASSDMNIATVQGSSENGGDSFDMFAEDENPITNPPSDENGLVSGSTAEPYSRPSSESTNMNSESGDLQTDYVYDESSGYYYSSSLGYYYDPTSGLYCSASSGKWYSYNEQAGTYDEVQGEEGASATPVN